MSEQAENDQQSVRLLTNAELNEITGDDVAYWLSNPFMDRERLGEKVRWWITVAAQADGGGA